MNTIRFIESDPKESEFLKSLRKRVNEYFQTRKISSKGNWALYFKTFALYAIYLVPFVLLMILPINVWIALALSVVIGIGLAGIGMSVMHDGAHGVYSKKKWLNRLAAASMYLLGSNVINWKIQHNLMHHTYTNIFEYDPDVNTKTVIRLNEHAPLEKFQRFQHIYSFFLYGLMTISKILSDFSQLSEYTKAGLTEKQNVNPKTEMLKLAFSKAAYFGVFLVLPIIVSDFTWWQVLIGFSMLHLTAGLITSIIFQLAHVVEGTLQPIPDENGVIHMNWAVHELLTTANFAPNNRILNWYIGGLNFQIEHHLFPNISHIHYRKIAPLVAQTAKEYGFEYNMKPTFRSALISHAKRLKELGRG